MSHNYPVKSEVFSASAGSGKTYTLALKYILLALESPNAFRSIQAITFTNKATAEMKSRIIDELAVLKQNPAQSKYINDIKRHFENLGNKTDSISLQKMADNVLRAMLEDYSRIRIKTIDSFFQEVLRSFAREMGQSGSYQVALNTKEILDTASTLMLTGLDRSKEKDLYAWLEKAAKEQLLEGKGHNIKNIITELANELSNEKLLNEIKKYGKLPSVESFKQLRDRVDSVIKSVEDEYAQLKIMMDEYIRKTNDPGTQYKGKSRSWFQGMKKRLEEGRYFDFTEKFEQDYHSDLNEGKCTTELETIACSFISISQDEELKKNYYTASCISNFLHNYGILSFLYEKANSLCKEENQLMISNTGNLVASIIGDNDAPFIYEKLGDRIDHHMIDEYQDTSELQDSNLKPLVEESISRGQYNLIVGDVKQSIYRWRNAKPSLLSTLFNNAGEDSPWNPKILDSNWRSLYNIVHFNNSIYKLAGDAGILQNLLFFDESKDQIEKYDLRPISDIYKAELSCQKIMKNNLEQNGLICIHRRKSTNKDRVDSNKYFVDPMESLPAVLRDIQLRGIKSNRIAILVRKGTEAVQVAKTLMDAEEERITHSDPRAEDYTFKILSSESLKIMESKSVRFIVDAMRYISRMNDKSLLKKAFQSYAQLSDTNEEGVVDDSLFFNDDEIHHLNELSRTDLISLTNSLIDFTKKKTGKEFQKNEYPYLIAFMDNISDYLSANTGDIGSFLDWWDDKADTTYMEAPEESNGIKLMTIHKAKGLEFDAVLAPFLNWRVDAEHYSFYKKNILWVELPDNYKQEGLEIVPVKVSSDLTDSHFAQDYKDERIKSVMDSINLLYVLTTRAVKELHIWLREDVDKKSKKLDDIGRFLARALDYKGNNDISLIEELKQEKRLIEILWEPIAKEADGNDSEETAEQKEYNPFEFLDKNEMLKEHFYAKETSDNSPEINLSDLDDGLHFGKDANKMIRIKSEVGEMFREGTQSKLDEGYSLHKVMEHIITIDDLPSALDQVIGEGLIKTTDREDVLKLLSSALNKEDVKSFFDGTYEVLNERTIVKKDSRPRPDRVLINRDGKGIIIIDYKFGEEMKKYKYQLNRYRGLFKEMGYDKVDAYIFYPREHKLIFVEEK